MRVGLAGLVGLAISLAATSANAQRRPQPPVVETTYTIPAAAAPGNTTQITVHNAPSGKPIGLWTNFGAQVMVVPEAESTKPRFRLAVSPETPVGIGAVRVYTAGGAGSVQLFMIDDLPSGVRSGGITSPQTAQSLGGATAVDGACEPLLSDYYRFSAKNGERVSIEVVAQRLGSRMDAVMRLLDSSGRELAYCDDSPGAGSDPRIAHRFQSDGNYLIELRDVNYEGGSDYRYRLRLGDFPLPLAAFPLAGKRGDSQVFMIDTADGTVGPIRIKLPAASPRRWLTVAREGGRGSGSVPVLCDDSEQVLPAHDNTSPDNALALRVPSAISGRFDRAGVRRFYALELKKGQRLAARARTRSVGVACDALLRLSKPDGTRLVDSRPGATPEDASLEATIPADGVYVLRVEELAGGGGPGMVYRLEVEPLRPDFALSVETEKMNVVAGRTFGLKVTCVRREFGGPIALSLTGDAAGFRLKNATIAADKKEVELQVSVPAEAATSAQMHFGVVGKARIGGTEVERTASTLPALKQVFPRHAYPPPELDGLIGLGIRAAAPASAPAPAAK